MLLTAACLPCSQAKPFLVRVNATQHGGHGASVGLKVHAQASSERSAATTTAESIKNKLARAVANTNRGRVSTPEQRQTINAIIAQLEAINPTRNPAVSDLISAKWSLLYQAPTNEEDAVKNNPDTTLEGPFLATLRPLVGGAVQSKGITQVIDRSSGTVQNIAEFTLFGRAQGFLNIRGTLAPVVPQDGNGEAVRVNVAFTDFELGLGTLKLTIPLSMVNPTGWVETTYLDDDFRIGRGDKGSVFVTVKQQKS